MFQTDQLHRGKSAIVRMIECRTERDIVMDVKFSASETAVGLVGLTFRKTASKTLTPPPTSTIQASFRTSRLPSFAFNLNQL